MNKLLQTTLISAILSTSVMAEEETGALPKIIESGATVYVNEDISIGGMHTTTIDNYGSIDTEVTEAPYPKLTGMTMGDQTTTINNHIGRNVKEEADETIATTLKVHSDLLYLGDERSDPETPDLEGAYKTVRIINKSDDISSLTFSIGDQGAETSYALEFAGNLGLHLNMTNYRHGSLTIGSHRDGDEELPNHIPHVMTFGPEEKQEIHVPINVENGMLNFGSETDIYSEINSLMPVQFHGPTTLKSGAVLRIGVAPVSSGS